MTSIIIETETRNWEIPRLASLARDFGCGLPSLHSSRPQGASTSIPRLEAIADPRLGEDVFRRASVRLQLFTQLAYEDAQIFVLLDAVAAPHRVEYGAVSQYLARMPRHVDEHIEFLGSEPHFPAGNRNGMGVEIDVEVAKVNPGLRRVCAWR